MTGAGPDRRGWYDDPDGTGQLRYWDGRTWGRYWEGSDGGRSPARAIDVVTGTSRAIRGGLLVAASGAVALLGVTVWGWCIALPPGQHLSDRWVGWDLAARAVAGVSFFLTYLGYVRWQRNVARLLSPEDPAGAPGRRRGRPPVALRPLWLSLLEAMWIDARVPTGIGLGLALGSFIHPSLYRDVDTSRLDALVALGFDTLIAIAILAASALTERVVRLMGPAVERRWRETGSANDVSAV